MSSASDRAWPRPETGGAMDWSDAVVEALRRHDVRVVAYVPDTITWRVLGKLEKDPAFHLVPCTREDDAIGVASGVYLGRGRAAVFVQSSGFGNCINALGSLAIPCRTPFPVFVGIRGDLWEFNIVQVPVGRGVAPIMQVLGMSAYSLDDPSPEAVSFAVEGALYTTFNTRIPVGLLIGPRLSGGKRI